MKYYGQNGQDQLLNEKYFKNKKNGVFVDIGAHDGISGNNTYFFEKELGWTGSCFEPVPEIFQKLRENRVCACYEFCAWIETTRKKFRVIKGHSEMLSGLVDTYHPQHTARISKEFLEHSQEVEDIYVDCYDINFYLRVQGMARSGIDLFSIDTEGSEEIILKHVNYDEFKIKLIITENNYGESTLRPFLEERGFELAERIGVDEVYVNKSLW